LLIGKDFERIEFSVLGVDLLEPNAFIGDSLILIVALFLASRTRKQDINIDFFKNWNYFYLFFGICMFLGGIGHLMFNYWGFYGKYIPWYLGIVSIFFLEKAMISLISSKLRILLLRISIIKLVAALILETIIFYYMDMSLDHSIGVRIPATNSAIGFIFSLGVLGNKFKKEIDKNFIYMVYSVFILLPSAIFLGLKINFHPWFDKNDFSHLSLIIAMFLFYRAIKSYGHNIANQSI